MNKGFLLLTLLFAHHLSQGQYWFGPKVGINYVKSIYQDGTVDDTYDIDDDFDFNAGVALSYSADDMFSVYGEITYERMNRDLREKTDDGVLLVSSEAVNQFISVPVMLRITLGRVPFHYYVNGGPKVSYWLASRGSLFLSSLEESVNLDPVTGELLPPEPIDYKVTFNPAKDNIEDVLLLSQPNRLQFGLTFGGGIYFDLISGARLLFDFRYSFGHSNLGFDDDDDNWFDYRNTDDYLESFEYSLNTASVSVAYLFGYNAEFKRRGRSTSTVR